jgi:hypothetical protein
MKRLLAKLSLAATVLVLGSAGATANVLVTIEQNGFGSGPIRVVSEDGKTWTKILDDDLTLPVSIHLGITSGYTAAYEIKQVATSLAYRIASGSGWSGETTLTVTGSTKNFAIEALSILNACNAKRNVGNGIHQKHAFWHGVELELIGYFDMTNYMPYPPYSAYGTVQVPVECLPYQGGVTVSGGDSANEAPLIIKDAKLFLTTYHNGQNDGVTIGACPLLKTTVRFETSKSGPVSFDLNRFPGGMTSHTVNAEFDPGSGKFYARYEKGESFDSTTNLQYMAQSTSPLGGNTGWKDITIHCGGGLAPDTGSSDPHDGLPTLPQLKGDFSFLADNGTSCPRKAKALINFTSSVKDNVHYSLDCTNGHFSGVAQTAPKPGGGYVAPALVTFDVTTTTQANCVLKSVAPGKPKIHTLKGHHYQCVNRAVDPASDDLTAAPKPKQKDSKDKAADEFKTKVKVDRDAAAKLAAKLTADADAKAKLKAAAEAERRRKAAEKAAAEQAQKDLAKKLKLLKANKTGPAAPRTGSVTGQTSVMRVR